MSHSPTWRSALERDLERVNRAIAQQENLSVLGEQETERLRELAQRVLSAGRAATSAPWVLLQADTVPAIVFHPAESDELRICNAWEAFDADDERLVSELVANFELIALYRSAAPALAAALLRLLPEPVR